MNAEAINSDEIFYTLAEICEKTRQSRVTLYKHINNGSLVVTYFGCAVRVSSTNYRNYIVSRPRSVAA